MLVTRCPDCDTTFRVTDEALNRASGRVRCGRCGRVFSALAELYEPGIAPPKPASEPPIERQAARTAAPSEQVAPEAPPPPPPPAPTAVLAPPEPAAAAAPLDLPGAGIPATSAVDVMAEVEIGAADPNADTDEVDMRSGFGDDQPNSPAHVERVLAVEAQPLTDAAARSTLLGEAEPKRASRSWSVAAVLALLALGLQALNHYRAELAADEVVGPWVQQAYAKLGITVTPYWDVQQYEILDWIATAEPNARGLGSLKITARIRNRGPLRQPYPAVRLRLKNRWEEVVGSRIFRPGEYLPHDTPPERLMAPGEPAKAEIEVVDPGPDAYGFELDVCIAVEANALTCRSDKVFL